MTSKIIPPEVLDQLKEAGQRLTIPRAPRDADDVIVLLKAWREYDLEQGQVAELTGVTRKMLWHWAAGTTTSGHRWPLLCNKMEKAGIPIADRKKIDHTRMGMRQPLTASEIAPHPGRRSRPGLGADPRCAGRGRLVGTSCAPPGGG